MRLALDDAAPLYRNAPEAEEPLEAGTKAFRAFVQEVHPNLPDKVCHIAGDLIAMTLAAPVSPGEIESVRTREVASIGNNRDAKTKTCRSVTDTFGPTGHRARGIVR